MKRNQYGSKAKTPDKWKWIWDEDYENKGKLPKKKNKNETVQNVVMEEYRAKTVNEMQDWRSDPREYYTQILMFLDEGDIDYDEAYDFIVNNGHWVNSHMADGTDPEEVGREIANILNTKI